jgi:hypothetical protein
MPQVQQRQRRGLPWAPIRNVSLGLPRTDWTIRSDAPSGIDPSRLRVQELRVEVHQTKHRSKGCAIWHSSICGVFDLDHLSGYFGFTVA